MPTTIHNFTSVERGKSLDFIVICQNADTSAFDLTDYTPTGQLRQHHASTVISAVLSCSKNSPATDGRINVSLTAAQTLALRPGKYVYEIIVTDSGGYVIRVITGALVITPTVVR